MTRNELVIEMARGMGVELPVMNCIYRDARQAKVIATGPHGRNCPVMSDCDRIALIIHTLKALVSGRVVNIANAARNSMVQIKGDDSPEESGLTAFRCVGGINSSAHLPAAYVTAILSLR